jgi:hypothetical protein
VAADADGVDVTAQPGTRIGITWLQDGLFQAQRANPTTRDLGPPDAYSFRVRDGRHARKSLAGHDSAWAFTPRATQ